MSIHLAALKDLAVPTRLAVLTSPVARAGFAVTDRDWGADGRRSAGNAEGALSCLDVLADVSGSASVVRSWGRGIALSLSQPGRRARPASQADEPGRRARPARQTDEPDRSSRPARPSPSSVEPPQPICSPTRIRPAPPEPPHQELCPSLLEVQTPRADHRHLVPTHHPHRKSTRTPEAQRTPVPPRFVAARARTPPKELS